MLWSKAFEMPKPNPVSPLTHLHVVIASLPSAALCNSFTPAAEVVGDAHHPPMVSRGARMLISWASRPYGLLLLSEVRSSLGHEKWDRCTETKQQKKDNLPLYLTGNSPASVKYSSRAVKSL